MHKLSLSSNGQHVKQVGIYHSFVHTLTVSSNNRWLNDKNSCPVCRKPLTGDQPDTDPNLTQGSAAGPQEGALAQQGLDRDMYANEVMFRMGRLQR